MPDKSEHVDRNFLFWIAYLLLQNSCKPRVLGFGQLVDHVGQLFHTRKVPTRLLIYSHTRRVPHSLLTDRVAVRRVVDEANVHALDALCFVFFEQHFAHFECVGAVREVCVEISRDVARTVA